MTSTVWLVCVVDGNGAQLIVYAIATQSMATWFTKHRC